MTLQFEVLGMVGTLNGKFVPIETPDAEPWYKIAHAAVSDIILTDGDRYCWKRFGELNIGDEYCWRLQGEFNASGWKFISASSHANFSGSVRDAIKRYHKEIDV